MSNDSEDEETGKLLEENPEPRSNGEKTSNDSEESNIPKNNETPESIWNDKDFDQIIEEW